MLNLTPKDCGSLGHGKRSPQKKATMTYLTKAPLNEALGTLEASNHSYQKAPLKATRTKMNGTLFKCLAALCMLGNVTAELGDGNGGVTLTCGCSEAISALRVEFQAKHDAQQALHDAQQALIDSVAHEVQAVRECSGCAPPPSSPPSPSPPPPSPSSPPPSPKPPCATTIDFALVLDESGSMKNNNGGAQPSAH